MCCRYVGHQHECPEHALAAVHILASISRSAQTQNELVGMLTASPVRLLIVVVY